MSVASISEQQVLPYHFLFQYLSKYDPEIIALIEYFKEIIFPSLQREKKSSPLPAIVSIKQLPFECMETIFSYLDGFSLCQSQCVCRDWNQLASIDHLWKELCLRSFRASPSELSFRKAMTSKDIYSSMHIVMQRTLRPKTKIQTNYSIPAYLLY